MSNRYGTAAVAGVASILTAAAAWPVLRSPTREIFGQGIAGRHHDPFTVMYQMAGSGPSAPFVQPATDWTGWLLARFLDPVAAYNVLVLATFPLTAVTTYLLARYLRLSHLAAAVAALVFAFAPTHVAQAAYHPHIAQTQWLPLYLLSLFALIDRPSIPRTFGLAAAAAALVASSFYMGFIGAVITPLALVGYWWTSPRGPRRLGRLGAALACLGAIVVAGIVSIAPLTQALVRDVATAGFTLEEVSLYRARPWAYLTPPVTHAVLGKAAAGVFARADVASAIVEQQIYVGYGPLLLSIVAGVAAARAWRTTPERRPLLALLAVGAAAAVVSIGPLNGNCSSGTWAPACQMHTLAPMFRAYARFAVVVQLTIAIAAGAGLLIVARQARVGRVIAAGLLGIIAFEYAPPPVQARDVLPTQAHRWLADGTSGRRILDCTPADPALQHVTWLMGQHVDTLGSAVHTCRDPYLASRAQGSGYTHVLIRLPGHDDVRAMADRPDSGLMPRATFPDSRVYEIAQAAVPVAVIGDEGLFEYEQSDGKFWRWMGARATWRVRNLANRPLGVSLTLDVQSADGARQVSIGVDRQDAATIEVGTSRASYTLGPWTLGPGDHVLTFSASGDPFQPSEHSPSPDDRRLSVAFYRQDWLLTNDPQSSSYGRTR